jgi:hypothetical protein
MRSVAGEEASNDAGQQARQFVGIIGCTEGGDAAGAHLCGKAFEPVRDALGNGWALSGVGRDRRRRRLGRTSGGVSQRCNTGGHGQLFSRHDRTRRDAGYWRVIPELCGVPAFNGDRLRVGRRVDGLLLAFVRRRIWGLWLGCVLRRSYGLRRNYLLRRSYGLRLSCGSCLDSRFNHSSFPWHEVVGR